MTPEQEIRFKALELKVNNVTRLAAACIVANQSLDGSKLWSDGDIEEFVDYITSGKKPDSDRGAP